MLIESPTREGIETVGELIEWYENEVKFYAKIHLNEECSEEFCVRDNFILTFRVTFIVPSKSWPLHENIHKKKAKIYDNEMNECVTFVKWMVHAFSDERGVDWDKAKKRTKICWNFIFLAFARNELKATKKKKWENSWISASLTSSAKCECRAYS